LAAARACSRAAAMKRRSSSSKTQSGWIMAGG
jgi:hypothetical protein